MKSSQMMKWGEGDETTSLPSFSAKAGNPEIQAPKKRQKIKTFLPRINTETKHSYHLKLSAFAYFASWRWWFLKESNHYYRKVGKDREETKKIALWVQY